MPYCSSCGSPIPEGQGSSCSMCYGDIAHGKDGYYEEWAREEFAREEALRQEMEEIERRMVEEEYFNTYGS